MLGGLVGRSAMRPVRRLTRGTRYVAVTQDLSRHVEAIGDDELASLARSFNAMLEALAESRRAQRQLIADASHELRTPLTTVQANVELLARGAELGEDERRQLREDLLAQLRELTALVGDLVELARERPPESELAELGLDALVAACVERARAREPRATFVCALHPCRVRADRPRLERAITNLLDNARKWSPPGGAVEVEVADGELVVRDEGPGIDEADLPYVFDRFYRSADARRLPGSGLGLAIVRQVAEMHGGAVWAAPPRSGRGAELHLRLSALPAERSAGRHFSDVHDKSHIELNSLTAPLTLAERSSACLSQIQFTSGACSVTIRSIFAHASARSFGSVSSSASSIALLISGTSSSGQFELPCWTMFLPLNVGSRIV